MWSCFPKKYLKFGLRIGLFPLLLIQSIFCYVLYIKYQNALMEGYINAQTLAIQKKMVEAKISSLVKASDLKKVKKGLEDVGQILKGGIDVETDFLGECGPPEGEEEVCKEKFNGPYAKEPWSLEKCSIQSKIEDLITIVAVHQGDEDPNKFAKTVVNSIGSKYSGVRVVIGTTKEDFVPDKKFYGDNVDIYGFKDGFDVWYSLLQVQILTKYVLVARSVTQLYGPWLNIERSLRLLGNDETFAVAGATRSMTTGHWETPCFQADIKYFNLVMRAGYKKSRCTCMLCDNFGANVPFVARTLELKEGLVKNLNSDLMFDSWFLSMKEKEGKVGLLCPDILYLIKENEEIAPSAEDWKEFSKIHKILGVSRYKPDEQIHSFSCRDIGLSCRPWEASDAHHIVPWCCHKAFNYIMKTFDEVSEKLEFQYEIISGTLLGAVKLNNFIPWDVDGDVTMDGSATRHFFSGGKGEKMMKEAGIEIFDTRNDAYKNIGAGYFRLWKDGLWIEFLGTSDNISLHNDFYSKVQQEKIPTRVLVGDTWLKTCANPGLHLRAQYRQDFYQHAQSWRAIPTMKDSGDAYYKKAEGGWQSCDVPSHQCVDRYPVDGNLDLLPALYPPK